jgi:hypothetical protein
MKSTRALTLRSPFRTRAVTRAEFEGPSPVLPADCANCGATAGHCSKEQHRGKTLLVPYCTRCFLGLERERTRLFFAAVSSVFVAATLLLTLPRLWPSAGVVPYAAISTLSACVPVVIALFVERVAGAGQTSGGRAVWWLGPHAIACTNEAWATALARRNEAASGAADAREPFAWPLLSGPVLALALAPLSFSFQHPVVVILNLGLEPFDVVVDGRPVAEVGVTSLESPASGVHVRLGAGVRHVELVSRTGAVLLQQDLELHAGRTHLYAPLSDEHCFWLERDSYGRVEPPEQRYRPLPEGTRFWTLPRDVDTWFHENPDPSTDDRSSGGTLVALRHARCSDAPEEVRSK